MLPGDIVQLKSGGPLMTVKSKQEISTYVYRVWVVYFTIDDRCVHEEFPSNVLKLVKPE